MHKRGPVELFPRPAFYFADVIIPFDPRTGVCLFACEPPMTIA
jgi:hypothetical protein